MNQQALQRLDALPPLPMVVQEVLQVLNNGVSGIAEISQAMAREPGLTGRIIASANAAFFSGLRPVYSVDDAVARLGLSRVRIIATSILLGLRFNPRRCPGFSARQFWQQAMRSSDCAARLAQVLPLETAKEAASLCGLLHNIGVLASAYAFPEAMERVFQARRAQPERGLAELQREELGLDHYQTGAELLARWGLPNEVVVCVRHRADEEYSGDYARLAAVVGAAARWAQEGFHVLPQHPCLRNLEERRLRQIGESCRRESGQLETFAMMLDAA